MIREAIHVRYSLLPYYYTLFREASVNGSPVMRPLWYEFPSDTETFTKSESFMIGNSILVQGIYIQVLMHIIFFSTVKENYDIYIFYFLFRC